MQSLAARSSAASDTVTDGSRSRADVIFLRSFVSSLAHVAMNAAVSLSNSSRRRTTSMRLGKIVRRLHLDRQAEAIQQLRAQLAFLGIAGADQHEPRGMTDAQAFALDDVFAGCGDVEQQIDQMIFQQIGLIDVKKAAMRPGQQSRLERLLAARQRPFQIERADDAILGRAERQIDHRHRHLRRFQRALGRAGAALVAEFRRPVRIAIVAAADDDLHLRQQRRQRAHRRGLSGAAIAEGEHAADLGIDRRDQQRELHLVLADDG